MRLKRNTRIRCLALERGEMRSELGSRSALQKERVSRQPTIRLYQIVAFNFLILPVVNWGGALDAAGRIEVRMLMCGAGWHALWRYAKLA